MLLVDIDRLATSDEPVVAEIRALLPQARLIALSSFDDRASATRAERVGFHECIPKVAAIPELLRRQTKYELPLAQESS
jgi:DNA-binding NarL/FixJ family response regulator